MTSTLTKNPRILLMGCGAVGGVLAGGLLHAGHNVEIVTHNPAISKAIAEEGLRLTTPAGLRMLPAAVCADACPDLDAVSGPFDLILLAMKATEVEDAAKELGPQLGPEAVVVTLQNGIVEDRVRAILDDGADRTPVIGALVGWGATMHAPGIYEMTSAGKTTIGELDGALTERLQQVRAVLDSAVPTVMTDNIYGALWSKLAINVVVTTLGAVTGEVLGQMMRRVSVRRLALAIISEVLDVAAAKGIELQPVAETLDLHRLYQPLRLRMRRWRPGALPKHLIMAAVGLKYRRLKSSMLQSLERGREPEIAFMNGYVVERAREVGVPVPINAALTEMVWEIAAGERESEPGNLSALL
jgi:2-dehydropantoate 2-reductase